MIEKENSLAEIVLNLEDFDEATTALSKLMNINLDKGIELSLDILENEKGDNHFQASAFELLYSINQKAGLNFINTKLELLDIIVFRAMLECVTEDSLFLEGNSELLLAVKKLKEKAKQLSSDDVVKIKDTLEWFEKSFK